MSRGENEELSASTSVSGALSGDLEALALAESCSAEEVDSNDAQNGAFPDFTTATTPPELRAMWSEPSSSDVPVRGRDYMADQLKVPAGEAVAKLLHFDLWTTRSPERRHHIARFDLQKQGQTSVIRYCAETFPDALVFVLNIELPDSNNVSLVSYWLVPQYEKKHGKDDDEQLTKDEHATFYRLLRRFVDQDDREFRDKRFKLIPSFTQAPWILNQLVQSRPALTGQKLTQHYFRGANYMEVDLDVSSSTVAHYIGSLCQSWATYIEVDVFITVQGEAEDELPERILGGVRIPYIDLSLAQPIDGDEEDDDEEEGEEQVECEQ